MTLKRTIGTCFTLASIPREMSIAMSDDIIFVIRLLFIISCIWWGFYFLLSAHIKRHTKRATTMLFHRRRHMHHIKWWSRLLSHVIMSQSSDGKTCKKNSWLHCMQIKIKDFFVFLIETTSKSTALMHFIIIIVEMRSFVISLN